MLRWHWDLAIANHHIAASGRCFVVHADAVNEDPVGHAAGGVRERLAPRVAAAGRSRAPATPVPCRLAPCSRSYVTE